MRRVGIVGAGLIAETHAASINSLPATRLTAVCDTMVERAERLAFKYGAKNAYESLADMLLKEDLDAVHVTTPPNAHFCNTKACLDNGIDVLIEKPMCIATRECEEIISRAQRSGVKVGVNHNLVYHPAFMALLDLVRAGALGMLEHVSLHYKIPLALASLPPTAWINRAPENVLMEVAPHPLSLIHRLFGDVTDVVVRARNPLRTVTGVTVYQDWNAIMNCQRGTASLYLSVSGSYYDLSGRLLAEDGESFLSLRRNVLTFSEKSFRLSPNDDLVDAVRISWGNLRAGVRNYNRYLRSALGGAVPYPHMYASMLGSIRAFHDATETSGFEGAPERGLAVVRACEKMSADIRPW